MELPEEVRLDTDTLRDLAKDICRGTAASKIDLIQHLGCVLVDDVVPELATLVEAASDQQYTVQLTHWWRFALVPSGALFLARIDKRTGAESLLVVTPEAPALRFCQPAHPHQQEMQRARHESVERRCTQLREAAASIEAFMMVFHRKLMDRAATMNLTPEQRQDIEDQMKANGSHFGPHSLSYLTCVAGILGIKLSDFWKPQRDW